MNELIEKCGNLKPSEEIILNAEELKAIFDPYDMGDLIFQYNLQEFFKKQGCMMIIKGHQIRVIK